MKLVFKIFTFLFVILIGFSCKKDVQPKNSGRFMKFYGTGITDFAYDLKQTTDGGYVIVGYTENSSNERKAYVIKTNSFGDLEWQKTYGEGSIFSEFKKVKIVENEFIFFGTYEDTLETLKKEMYLVKTDLNGEIIYEEKHGGPENQEGNDFGIMPDGSLVLGGSSTKANNVTVGNADGSNPVGAKDFYIIKVSSSGDSILNSYQAGGGNDDEINVLKIDYDGSVYASGVLNYRFTFANLDNNNISIIKLNTQDGKFAVDDNFGFGSRGNDVCTSIIFDSEGIVLAGNINQEKPNNSYNSFIYQIPSKNDLRTIDSTLNNAFKQIDYFGFEVKDIKKTTEDGYLVTGYNANFAMLNIDSEGNVIWNINNFNEFEGATSGIQTSEGGFAAVGNTGFGVDSDIMLLKVNAAGEL